MATRRVKLSGIGFWGKVFPENRDLTGFENALADVGGQTSIDVDLDEANMALLRKSKSMKRGTPSPDNDGLTRVKFTRRWEDKVSGGAPKVVKADGTDWDFDVDGLIGNGSKVEVVLSVYDTSRKAIVGTRLEKVKVVEHKVYDPDAEEDDAPAPNPISQGKVTKPLPKASNHDDMEDSIPF